jgi:hypothetical protein
MNTEAAVHDWAFRVRGRPFAWGETDCAILTLEGLELLTGHPCVAGYRGLWASREEALAHFSQELPSDVLKGLGAVEVAPAFAVFGDVITLPADPWPEQLHFILGRYSLVSDEERGVGLAPTRVLLNIAGARVWRVAKCLRQFH